MLPVSLYDFHPHQRLLHLENEVMVQYLVLYYPFSTYCQCLVALWLPHLKGIQFFRYGHEYFIPLPSYMHGRLTCQPATRPTGRAKRGPEEGR